MDIKTVKWGVSLDDALIEYYDNPMVVKMDIEGNEHEALAGGRVLLGLSNKRFAICTYHNYDDTEIIQRVFQDNNYQTEFSKRYMLNLYSELKIPFFGRVFAEHGSHKVRSGSL